MTKMKHFIQEVLIAACLAGGVYLYLYFINLV